MKRHTFIITALLSLTLVALSISACGAVEEPEYAPAEGSDAKSTLSPDTDDAPSDDDMTIDAPQEGEPSPSETSPAPAAPTDTPESSAIPDLSTDFWMDSRELEVGQDYDLFLGYVVGPEADAGDVTCDLWLEGKEGQVHPLGSVVFTGINPAETGSGGDLSSAWEDGLSPIPSDLTSGAYIPFARCIDLEAGDAKPEDNTVEGELLTIWGDD